MLLGSVEGATLTIEVIVQVRNAPVADGNGRLANLARSNRGYCEGRVVRLRVGCECIVEKRACG
jgi:hypothetical protein